MLRLFSTLVILALFVGGSGCGSSPSTNSSKSDRRSDKKGDAPNADGIPITLKELVAGLPENARPKASGDTVSIDNGNKWLTTNAVGKRIKDLHYFEHVMVSKAVGNRRTVVLVSNDDNKINTVEIPGVDAKTRERWSHLSQWPVEFYSLPRAGGRGITIQGADDALAQRLNDLRLRTCEVAGTVMEVSFEPKSTEGIPPRLLIALSDVTINSAPEH